MLTLNANLLGLTVYGPRYLVRAILQTQSPGGVDLPDSVAESANRVEILVVGDGKTRGWAAGHQVPIDQVEMPLKVGDIVIVEPRMVMALQYEGEKLGLIDIDAVLVKLP